MKVFISQPMNGRSDEEILEERKFAERFLKTYYDYDYDIEIIDSFTKSPELVTKGRIAMLGNSIQLMSDADLVLFMPDWNTARGCIVEHVVAEKYGLKILYMTGTMAVSYPAIIVKILDPEIQEKKNITLKLD